MRMYKNISRTAVLGIGLSLLCGAPVSAQIQPPNTKPDIQSAAIKRAATIPVEQNWAHILKTYVRSDKSVLNRFDYAALKANPKDMASLDGYLKHAASRRPSKMSKDAAMAYWANLYNALTVQVVTQNYPVTSIRKIRTGFRAGPWRRDLITVEGKTLTLDNIEHDIMRPTYKTPLVHYMVNCASIGCPNLKATPWTAATLTQDQEAAARVFINSPRGAVIDGDRLQVSSIYKWFKKDFGGTEAGVLSHLRTYANPELAMALKRRKKIDKYAYDWDVNAPK